MAVTIKFTRQLEGLFPFFCFFLLVSGLDKLQQTLHHNKTLKASSSANYQTPAISKFLMPAEINYSKWMLLLVRKCAPVFPTVWNYCRNIDGKPIATNF